MLSRPFSFLIIIDYNPNKHQSTTGKGKKNFPILDYYIQCIMIEKWRKKNLLIINECSRYHSFLQKKILAFGSLMNRKKNYPGGKKCNNHMLRLIQSFFYPLLLYILNELVMIMWVVAVAAALLVGNFNLNYF